MYAQTLRSTEGRYVAKSRPAASKRSGYSEQLALKVLALFLGMLGLVCAMLCTYSFQSAGYVVPADPSVYNALKIVETVSTVLLLFAILAKYRAFLSAELRQQRLRGLSWHNAGHVWASLLIEFAVCAVFCPAGVSGVWYSNPTYFSAPESFDGVIASVMMLRVYLFVPLLPELTGWRSAAAYAAGRFTRVRVDDWLALRAILITHPILSIVSLWVVIVASFAWALQAAEYSICSGATPAIYSGPSPSPWGQPGCEGAFGAKNLNDYQTVRAASAALVRK